MNSWELIISIGSLLYIILIYRYKISNKKTIKLGLIILFAALLLSVIKADNFAGKLSELGWIFTIIGALQQFIDFNKSGKEENAF